MTSTADTTVTLSPLATRLSRLARLDAATLAALAQAGREQRRSPPRREMIAEGDVIRKPLAVLSGWAFRQRILSDGRRQIVDFLIPGDLIGLGTHRHPIESPSIVAVTQVVTCVVPDADAGTELAEAYALSAALEKHYLVQHTIRLGRLTAQERLIDWFLEMQGRLTLAGIVSGDAFSVPLTQELLADTLGLTNVHVNRTLQVLRREGLMSAQGGAISLTDRAQLQMMVDHQPPRFIPKA
jgi:CRP-like cAMP-binding protein